MDDSQSIHTLRDLVRRADEAYRKGEPFMSDEEYDMNAAALRSLDPDSNPGFLPPEAGREKVTHEIPMLSLDNAFTDGDVKNYIRRVKATSAQSYIYLEHKLDGMSATLMYVDGMLSYGATRGDGTEGENITANLSRLPSVPAMLPKGSPNKLEVRGEVIMPVKAFAESTYSNPRNAAAGAIRQLDPEAGRQAGLEFIAWGIGKCSREYRTYEQVRKLLSKAGFIQVQSSGPFTELDSIMYAIRTFEKDREEGLEHEIDGIVLKMLDLEAASRMGASSRAPRSAVAYKFTPPKAVTTVKSIVVQVGRTGALTPVANLHPVRVGGVTVSRATLHNEDEINRLGLCVGDTVELERAGEVIPKIRSVISHTGGEAWRMPTACPSCGTATVSGGQVVSRCPARWSCQAQAIDRLSYLVSKDGLDLKGYGPSWVAKTWSEGSRTPADIVRAAGVSRKVKLSRALTALGIRGYGPSMCSQIASRCSSWEDAVKVLPSEEKHHATDFLRELDRTGCLDLSKPGRGPLWGKMLCITGTMSVRREDLTEEIEAAGGRVSGSITRNVDWLVAGNGGGGKRKKAELLRVPVISERDLRKMMKEIND